MAFRSQWGNPRSVPRSISMAKPGSSQGKSHWQQWFLGLRRHGGHATLSGEDPPLQDGSFWMPGRGQFSLTSSEAGDLPVMETASPCSTWPPARQLGGSCNPPRRGASTAAGTSQSTWSWPLPGVKVRDGGAIGTPTGSSSAESDHGPSPWAFPALTCTA